MTLLWLLWLLMKSVFVFQIKEIMKKEGGYHKTAPSRVKRKIFAWSIEAIILVHLKHTFDLL